MRVFRSALESTNLPYAIGSARSLCWRKVLRQSEMKVIACGGGAWSVRGGLEMCEWSRKDRTDIK